MTMQLRPSQIAFWPLDRLKPYARNAKTHDASQVAKIAASMVEFGWTVPCLVAAGQSHRQKGGSPEACAPVEEAGMTQSRRMSLIEAITNVAVAMGWQWPHRSWCFRGSVCTRASARTLRSAGSSSAYRCCAAMRCAG